MPSLSARLNDLASRFADNVFAAIRSASLDELVADGREAGNGRRAWPAPKGQKQGAIDGPATQRGRRRTGRLARRSSDDITATLGRVVAALKAGPMRSEEIQKLLALDKRELPRVIAVGLKTRAIKRRGQRRGTTYSA